MVKGLYAIERFGYGGFGCILG